MSRTLRISLVGLAVLSSADAMAIHSDTNTLMESDMLNMLSRNYANVFECPLVGKGYCRIGNGMNGRHKILCDGYSSDCFVKKAECKKKCEKAYGCKGYEWNLDSGRCEVHFDPVTQVSAAKGDRGVSRCYSCKYKKKNLYGTKPPVIKPYMTTPPKTAHPTSAPPATAHPTTADPHTKTASPTYEPNTMAPSTSATTAHPTTATPATTAHPSTDHPTTEPGAVTASPSTEPPTLSGPISNAPTTAQPTTAQPTTTSPTTAHPTTAHPTKEPDFITASPSTEPPTLTRPISSAPTTTESTTAHPTASTAHPTAPHPATDHPTMAPPTTAHPTTAPPTTTHPTTAPPTTAHPTTAHLTTAHPTTAHPTTAHPTTAHPTTTPPTTAHPTITPPTTAHPTTASPTTAPPTPIKNSGGGTRTSPTRAPTHDHSVRFVRKEVGMVTDDVWEKYSDAIMKLQKSGIWLTYARVHELIMRNDMDRAHGHSQFWPWHREFLRAMEIELKMTLPENERADMNIIYWDWTDFSRTSAGAKVFERMGGFEHDSSNCISQGSFAMFDRSKGGCIRRRATFAQVTFDTADVANALEKAPDTASPSVKYDTARKQIENLHNGVHANLGCQSGGGASGHMCSGMAPYDPFFYAHHAYIDLLWQQWQDASASNKFAYFGSLTETLDWFGKSLGSNDDSTLSGVQATNLYNNNDFSDVDVSDTMEFQAIKDPRIVSLNLLQVNTDASIDGDHPVFAQESQEVKDVAANVARMMHDTAAAHVAQHNQAQLAEHAAKHADAEAGSAAVVLLEAASKAVLESDGKVHKPKEMNTVEYDETTAECLHEHCLTVKDMVPIVKVMGIENVPRLCPPMPLIVKGSANDNNRWWTPEGQALYDEQLARYKKAIKRFGEKAVKKNKGGCLPIGNIIQDVAKVEKAAEEAAM